MKYMKSKPVKSSRTLKSEKAAMAGDGARPKPAPKGGKIPLSKARDLGCGTHQTQPPRVI